MGRGTWYYSLGVFLEIVDVFVRSEVLTIVHVKFEKFPQACARVDVNVSSGVAIDSYESVDVVVGENWLLRHKAEMVCHEKVVKMPWCCKVRVGSNGNLLWEASVLGRKKGGDDVAKTVFRIRNGHVEVYSYAFWVNQCTNGFHGVNEPVAREDDRGVTEGREDVREVFQQHGSRAKRKLSICGRNQMGNEPILALPEGADNFVV
ncbi:hypothetical protein Tco_0011865 [Tanacetum coccineum]